MRGPDNLPLLGANDTSFSEKKATDEIKDEITKHSSEVVDEIKEIRNQSQEGSDEIKKTVSDIIDPPYEDPYKDINKRG